MTEPIALTLRSFLTESLITHCPACKEPIKETDRPTYAVARCRPCGAITYRNKTPNATNPTNPTN